MGAYITLGTSRVLALLLLLLAPITSFKGYPLYIIKPYRKYYSRLINGLGI